MSKSRKLPLWRFFRSMRNSASFAVGAVLSRKDIPTEIDYTNTGHFALINKQTKRGSRVNIKQWVVAGVAMFSLAACGIGADQSTQPTVSSTGTAEAVPTAVVTGQTIARVGDVTLTRQILDERIARIEKGLQSGTNQGAMPSKQDIERQLVGMFIDQNLVLGLAKQRNISIDDKEIDKEIGEVRISIAQSGGTIEEAVQNQLGFPGVESAEFRQFMSFFIAQRKISETLVSTDTVRQELEAQIGEMTKKTDQVHAAHILVETEEEAT